MGAGRLLGELVSEGSSVRTVDPSFLAFRLLAEHLGRSLTRPGVPLLTGGRAAGVLTLSAAAGNVTSGGGDALAPVFGSAPGDGDQQLLSDVTYSQKELLETVVKYLHAAGLPGWVAVR